MVAFALLILVFGVVSFLVNETRLEEEMIDEWVPKPAILYPEWGGINRSDHTGSFFILRARGENEDFMRLLDGGKISELRLEINVSANGTINVKVGRLVYPFRNDTTGETLFLEPLVFNRTSEFINELVSVTGINATNYRNYWLEIRNKAGAFVEISGLIRVKVDMPKVYYPYYGIGTLMCLFGVSLMVYGFLAKPKRKLR